LESERDAVADQALRIRREMVQLVVLVVLAAGAFLATRAVASANRLESRRDAAEWYERGRRFLSGGDFDRAIEAFHHATVRNRDERRFALALASALAAKGQDGPAVRVLLSLREAVPEATDVNVQLARLAAQRQDLRDAIRYYQSALYAPWGADQAGARRAVRVELVRFLLEHGQAGRALAELLALSADLPDEAAPHIGAGELFARAGDHRHALEQFQRALRTAPADPAALAGAGGAAFELGDYASARRYLSSVPPGVTVGDAREVVEAVLTRDPLANRIPSNERERRLRANLAYAGDRLDTCLRDSGASASEPDQRLSEQVRAIAAKLDRPGASGRDTLESGVDLSFRIAERVAQACPRATPVDQALAIIGREHGASER
jgi:Tfp pilus assembly protein PilF